MQTTVPTPTTPRALERPSLSGKGWTWAAETTEGGTPYHVLTVPIRGSFQTDSLIVEDGIVENATTGAVWTGATALDDALTHLGYL